MKPVAMPTVFDISNQNLTTLVGVDFPNGIKILSCDGNQLTTLEGCPDGVMELNCRHNRLTSLKGCPQSVTLLVCCYNQLSSFEGCSANVKEMWCDNNNFTTLEGCPESVTELRCSYNQLISLKGCPPGVFHLDITGNLITSLEDLPHNIERASAWNNPLNKEYKGKSIAQVCAINRVKAYKKGIDRLNMIFAIRIQRWWKRKWYDEMDSEGVSRFCRMSIRDALVCVR